MIYFPRSARVKSYQLLDTLTVTKNNTVVTWQIE